MTPPFPLGKETFGSLSAIILLIHFLSVFNTSFTVQYHFEFCAFRCPVIVN